MKYNTLPSGHRWSSKQVDIYYHNEKVIVIEKTYFYKKFATCSLCNQELFKTEYDLYWRVVGIKSTLISCKEKQLELQMHEALE